MRLLGRFRRNTTAKEYGILEEVPDKVGVRRWKILDVADWTGKDPPGKKVEDLSEEAVFDSIDNHPEIFRSHINKRKETPMSFSPSATAVLKALRQVPKRGLTDDEIAERTGLNYESASRRRRDLVAAGVVRNSDSRRSLSTGYSGTVWTIV